MYLHSNIVLLQVAVLAPLALLLVLEARCVHFVIAHFNCRVDDKLVSEHYPECNGNSSAPV